VAVGRLAVALGFKQISLSSQVMPMVKLVARGDTTMVDAYLNPHIQRYLNSFRQGFSDGLKTTSLLFMQSDGGLVRADNFTGSRAILSERRVYSPYGLEGGQPGKRDQNLFIRKDGRSVYMGSKNEIKAEVGDRFRILTPGGGGFGKKT
jgi:hypothetical protein